MSSSLLRRVVAAGAGPLLVAVASTAVCAQPAVASPGQSSGLPDGFSEMTILEGLDSPASFDFAPDGRIFFTERVKGHIRVATESPAGSGQWQIDPEPYASFDVPKVGGIPTAHRSSGVRGFAFDPDFASNGYVYVFYMKHNPRQNRVVRIRQNPADPSRALPGETLLIELPFNASGSSGSHNGGALRFGTDELLYITTGDGWTGGDSTQSLSTFTGKVLRIRPDGSIPNDNPFYSAASGDYRAIYALGLRNPYTLTRNESNGWLLIGEANGENKANLLRLQAGANYRHQGFAGIGTGTGRWVDAASAGSKMIAGGAWYPDSGPFPSQYHGAFFTALWGTNGANGGPPGQLSYVRSAADRTVSSFQANVGQFDGAGTRLKPVHVRVGPDGSLYYLLTSYMTGAGSIARVRFEGAVQVATPVVIPPGGSFADPIEVSVRCATPDATIRYTTDGSTPNSSSPVTAGHLTLPASTTLRARAFFGSASSATANADFQIGGATNVAPIAHAGPDRFAEVNTLVLLNGAATTDPDGSALNLSEEWQQTGGPPTQLGNSDETVAYFFPTVVGRYEFVLWVTDGIDRTGDKVAIEVVACVNDVTDGMIARWQMDEVTGDVTLDTAAGLWNGQLDGPTRTRGPKGGFAALAFDGVDDLVHVEPLDASGDEFSVTGWVCARDFDVSDARILSKATGTAEQQHYWMLSTVGAGSQTRLRFRVRVGGTTRTLVASHGALVERQWHFVAATYDGSRMRLYLDGVQVGVQSASGSLATSPNVPVAIGNQPQGGRPFDGLLDDIRVYSRALNLDDLHAISALEDRFDCGG